MLVLLFALVAVSLPLGVAVMHRVALDQTTAQALRFATSAPNTPELGATTPAPGCRRPSLQQVRQEASDAWSADGGSGSLANVSVAPPNTANGVDPTLTGCSTNPPGTPVTVSVTAPLDLGAVAELLTIVGFSTPSTMTATALGREE